MKKSSILSVAGLIVTVFAVTPVHAQYVIGDFQYTCPIGAQWSDPRCIRTPIGSSDQGETAPVQSRRWFPTWGAIVMDKNTGDVGTALGSPDKGHALRAAKRKCEAAGSKDCTHEISYFNQCVAIAYPAFGSGRMVVQNGPKQKDNEVLAVNSCAKQSSVQCKVVYSECSKPILK